MGVFAAEGGIGGAVVEPAFWRVCEGLKCRAWLLVRESKKEPEAGSPKPAVGASGGVPRGPLKMK